MRWFARLRASPFLLAGVFSILLGVLIGLGTFTISYAKGTAYLSDDPAACVNCHVMREEYNAWTKSSHKSVAVCNSCHMPHDNDINKWFTKALNGFNHSLAFTTGSFPATIRIRERNAEIVQANCIHCHQELVSQVYGLHADQDRRCVSCHGNVGHENHPFT